jgi:hypothetical protein
MNAHAWQRYREDTRREKNSSTEMLPTHTLAEASALHRAARYRRLAHLLSGWLPRVCDAKTAWFADQLATELRVIADEDIYDDETMRWARKHYIKERVTDALSYFVWRVKAHTSPGLAVELACHLAGVDVYAVMNGPRLHPAHSKHAPQYLVSIRNAAGW